MPVYVVAQIKIHDRERYAQYEAGFVPIFARYNGTFLGLTEDPEIIEGQWPHTRAVLLSFPTRDDARAWIDSDEYQVIAAHRKAAAESSIILIPEFVLPTA